MIKISIQYFGGRGGGGSGGARGGSRAGGGAADAQTSWSSEDKNSRTKFNKELKAMMAGAAVGDTIKVTQRTKEGTYTETLRKMEPGSTYTDAMGKKHVAKSGETWAWSNQGRDRVYDTPVTDKSASGIIKGTGNTGSLKVTAAEVKLYKKRR